MACRFLYTPAAALVALLLQAAAASATFPADGGLLSRPAAAALSFEEGYTQLFGDSNLRLHGDGKRVHISLDERTGAGFASQGAYLHGFFSARIKLPSDYAAGVVVAFYMTNGDVYEKTHDELDFEFLGSRWGGQWRVQTNVYGNGSTSRGREERYLLPFDPTVEAHRYSILWAPTHIIFYVDDTPIREVIRHAGMGGDFPAKPMAVYATIWDGSAWATEGGKYKVNYKYAPFASDFSDLALHGCRVAATHDAGGASSGCELLGLMTADYAVMTPRKRAAMRAFRARQMTYTVCYDAARYAAGPFPECDNSDQEKEAFWAWGESKTVVMKTSRGRGRRGRGSKAGAAKARAGVVASS